MSLGRPLFELGTISAAMVQEQIEALSLESHSFGPDGISPFCLCKTLPVILEYATGLFNLSVTLTRFPTLWKRAFIRPLSKSRTPKSASETRPIANISVLSKMFERIIHKQITGYAEKFDIFDPKQSGYRSSFIPRRHCYVFATMLGAELREAV